MRSNRLNLAIGIALAIGLGGCADQASTPRGTRELVKEDRKTGDAGQEKDRDAALVRQRLDDAAPPVPAEPAKVKATPSLAGEYRAEIVGQAASTPAPGDRKLKMAESVAPVTTASVVVPAQEAPASLAIAPPAPPAPPARALADKGLQASAPVGMTAPKPVADVAANTEKYKALDDNPLQITAENPVSTFSVDVDTGSYTNVRRMLRAGQLPPAAAVRAEEFLNYFDYAYTPPATRDTPFSVTTELASAPWNAQRKLMLVGIKGFELPASQIPASNLVFLIDSSGSMNEPDKLPLLRDAFKQMVPNLRARDRVSIVVYAGSAGLVLPPTAGDQHERIIAALDSLSAGGSTNGGAGIQLAYATAEQAFIKGGINRVVLATDGDFNVGTTSTDALKTLVADKRTSGIALTTLGFGQGNYNDELSEQLADIGNGNHAFVDNLNEARKVLVEEAGSTLFTIAKDVKIQVEFNPQVVAEYRLIGYENRQLRREDFNNDKVDAGEIGAGHDVTALYELTLVGEGKPQVDPLRYARGAPTATVSAEEIAFVKLRYKQPDQDTSRLIERPIRRGELNAQPSERLRFAAAVAAFADSLRGGTHAGQLDLAAVANLARDARGTDRFGYRAEFVQLVEQAQSLQTPNRSKQIAISR